MTKPSEMRGSSRKVNASILPHWIVQSNIRLVRKGYGSILGMAVGTAVATLGLKVGDPGAKRDVDTF